MAPNAELKPYMSYADFVVFERQSETKHEWLDGVVYDLHVRDMAGGSISHARLAVAVSTALGLQLRGKRCAVFNSDLKIKVLATGLATYPDLSVVCGSVELDPDNDHAITNPKVIVEILSASTEAYDRGGKFAHYRRIPSLMEYVLLSQDEPRIEVYRRNATGTWELHEALAGQTAKLTSIECELSVDEIYADPLSAP